MGPQTQSASPQRRRSWQGSAIRCMEFAALICVHSSCTTSAIFAVEAKKPCGWSPSALARSCPPAPFSDNQRAGDDNRDMRPPSRRLSGPGNVSAFLQMRPRPTVPSRTLLLQRDAALSVCVGRLTKIRGGSSEEEEEEEEEYDGSELSNDEEYGTDSDTDATDESDVEEEYDSSEEQEREEDPADETQSSLQSSVLSKSRDSSDANSDAIVKYDDVLVPPPMQQLGVTIGVLMLSSRVDLFNAKAVKIVRCAFLAYIVSVQVFLLYVRFRAKAIDDRAPVTLRNPLASLVDGASAGGAAGGGSFVVKALADQVLSTQTTVLEYDLKEAKRMNGGLLFPMVFLYFLHFKMKQVQPLLMQTATGMLNLVYSPLFQVYVMGKNLERPFKPPTNPMMEAMQQQQRSAVGEEESHEGSVASATEDGDEDSENEGEGEISDASEEEQMTSDEETGSEYDEAN